MKILKIAREEEFWFYCILDPQLRAGGTKVKFMCWDKKSLLETTVR